MGGWTTEFIEGAPRIAYDHTGKGPLVVFLHGVGGNRTNWHLQLPVFARHFHVVAVDGRGYGASDDYEGPLDFGDFSHDLIRLLDRFGTTRAHLVGNSMGGRIAQDFYMFYPERVATLVLYATYSGREPERLPTRRKKYLELRKKPLIEGKTPADIAPVIARNVVGPKASAEAFKTMVESIAAVHKESYLKTLDAMTFYPRRSDLENIKAPTLLIYGEADSVTPPRFGQEMARRIPGAELVVVPDSGHMLNVEMPAEFDRHVLGFLLRHKDRAF
ncbi:MAG: alpha/beta hydrolase [Rhodospirillales bacterium]|nr:alpha/beta hydrolase [Rhodospirillales bacterium]